MPKWSSKGKVGQALRREIIENKYIQRGIKASEVQKNNALYRDFKSDNFRTNYNKMCSKISEEQRREESAMQDLRGGGPDGEFDSLFYFKFKM